jgi:hypothetical protein
MPYIYNVERQSPFLGIDLGVVQTTSCRPKRVFTTIRITKRVIQTDAGNRLPESNRANGNCLFALPILDTLQKMTNSLLVNVDIPINTKRLKD